MKQTSFAAVLGAAGLALTLGQQALAQEDALRDLARELAAQDQANRTTADSIEQSLADCLPPQDGTTLLPVTFAIALGPSGAPARPADLVEPPANEAQLGHIQQLLRGEAAVTQCAPITVDGKVARDTVLVIAATDTSLVIEEFMPLDGPVSGAATEADEAELELSRDNRREIQVRLKLAGYDPRGADGIFGARTRDAISGFQASQRWPVTGFLNAVQIETLVTATQVAYVEYLENAAEQEPVRRSTRKRVRVYRGSDGCLRYAANRRIVPNQTLRCDAKRLIRSF